MENMESPITESPEEQKQAINEAVVNIPRTFRVGDRTIEIHAKSINRMVLIDKLIIKLQLIGNEEVDIDDDMPFEEAVKKVQDKHERLINAMVEIIYSIVNEDLKKPVHDKDWLKNYLDVSEDGLGHQIMDAYNDKCDPSSLLKKILLSRKF